LAEYLQHNLDYTYWNILIVGLTKSIKSPSDNLEECKNPGENFDLDNIMQTLNLY